jgi:hypothetical protein
MIIEEGSHPFLSLVRAYAKLPELERDLLDAYICYSPSNSDAHNDTPALRALLALAGELRKRIAELLPPGAN